MDGQPAAQLDRLVELLERATGAEAPLDAALAEAFGRPAAPFTGSAEAARALIAAVLPGWRVHVGFDVSGVFPYVRLSSNGDRVEAGAASLPLALLRALVAAARLPAPQPEATAVPAPPSPPVP